MFGRERAGFPHGLRASDLAAGIGGGVAELRQILPSCNEAVTPSLGGDPHNQRFIGETDFKLKIPIDFLSLTRWCQPIVEEGVEGPLTRTIQAGRKSGAIDAGSLKPAAVDRTVIEMNIVHPTDARLFERGGANRAGLAQEAGIKLRPIPRSPGGKTLCEALRERPSRHETVSRQIARIPPWQ